MKLIKLTITLITLIHIFLFNQAEAKIKVFTLQDNNNILHTHGIVADSSIWNCKSKIGLAIVSGEATSYPVSFIFKPGEIDIKNLLSSAKQYLLGCAQNGTVFNNVHIKEIASSHCIIAGSYRDNLAEGAFELYIITCDSCSYLMLMKSRSPDERTSEQLFKETRSLMTPLVT